MDIEGFVRELNEMWLVRQYDQLPRFFHENAVLLVPGSDQTIVGVEPIVESYREFDSLGSVSGFEIEEIVVQQFEGVAMCHMKFSVEYEVDGETARETALEIYAIDTAGPEPKVAWRTQMTLSSENG